MSTLYFLVCRGSTSSLLSMSRMTGSCVIIKLYWLTSLIARFMGPGGAHLGPTGPRWAPWTLLSGLFLLVVEYRDTRRSYITICMQWPRIFLYFLLHIDMISLFREDMSWYSPSVLKVELHWFTRSSDQTLATKEAWAVSPSFDLISCIEIKTISLLAPQIYQTLIFHSCISSFQHGTDYLVSPRAIGEIEAL